MESDRLIRKADEVTNWRKGGALHFVIDRNLADELKRPLDQRRIAFPVRDCSFIEIGETMNEHMKRFAPLPDNFIVYNHDDPSPQFPPEKVAYIESINSDFSEEELRAIRSIKRFALNLNTGGVGGDEFAGLRKQEEEDSLYFKRFSDEPLKDLVKAFLAHIPTKFEDRRRTLMHLHRATLPNGDRYYPITFAGDLAAWKRHLLQAAIDCGTLLGWFDKGKFVLSDGSQVRFLDLQWDRILHRQRIPKKW